jgi:cephalosporin hydroxylase
VESIDEAVDLAFGFGGAFLNPVQVRPEIRGCLEEVAALRPRTVIEIGTAGGATLYLWTRIADPEALIISIDLPGGPFGGGYSLHRVPVYRSFARPGQTIHLLRADSHAPATLARVKRLLAGRRVDYLFIDGDHTYDGVSRDWAMYSPLVRSGGLVAFHDIVTRSVGVRRLWQELRCAYPSREYVEADSPYGIGLVTVSPLQFTES